MTPTRPILNYHGSKYRLAPRIIGCFPPHRVYVEPYGGGAGVLIRKEKINCEVYNDLSGDVVNVFRVLRDPQLAARLQERLWLTPWARAEYDLAYQPSDDMVESAARMIVRSFMAHGTSFMKGNRSGFRAKAFRQNQPASIDWCRYPGQIPAFVDRLRGVTVDCRDALAVIEQQDGRDVLFYCDPPYPVSTRSAIRSLADRERAYTYDMSDDEHRALAAKLADVAGMVVVSGYACPLYDQELYAGWRRVELDTVADGGAKRTEVLWINAAACNAASPLFSQAAE